MVTPQPTAVQLIRFTWRRTCAADVIPRCQNQAAYMLTVEFGNLGFRLPVCDEHARQLAPGQPAGEVKEE